MPRFKSWFANQVNTGLNNAIKGKLMNNIDLSEVIWTPIGNSSTATKKYAGTFDGNGKTVTLALQSSATAGLFGYLNDATVKNLTVAGSVTGGKYTAGIAGNATTATIENCINNATITSTSYEVGGIVGYTTDTTTVTGCTNNGAVTATYNVGGIVGYTYAASTIDQCCNTGAVKGGVMNVGGVAGYLNNASKLTDAYNTGSVTSESTSSTAHTGGISPVIAHSGNETAVFVHLRNGFQLELNASRADFDLVQATSAGFNVLAGDVVKVYLVDELSNAVDFNPTIIQ